MRSRISRERLTQITSMAVSFPISPITSLISSKPRNGPGFCRLCPKPQVRIEGGGATGGLCFQQAWESIASGRYEVAAAMASKL